MAMRRITLVAIACFSIGGFAGQPRQGMPPVRPRWERGMTAEEHAREMERWREQHRLWERKRAHEQIRLLVREAWKHELRVTERQWRIIEPKYEREELVSWTTWASAAYGIKDGQTFYWRKATEDRGGGWAPPKTPDELTEGQRIVSELIDLLRQEDARDEELRQKIDALQQVREKARKELPKARRELAALLTTPRQEAVFLIMGRID